MLTGKPKTLLLTAISGLIVFLACKKSSTVYAPPTPVDPVTTVLNLPVTPFNYANPVLPAYFTTQEMLVQINTQTSNPITNNGATLGRVLFYDKNLSANNTVSCGSCHKPANGFSDPDRFSKGFHGGLTRRNSMSLINAIYFFNERFFWDQRAPILEELIPMPIQDSIEMGMTIPELELKLRQLPYYPILFTRAFGDSMVTIDRISRAITQFIRSIISYQSKYDAGRKNFPAFPGPPPNAVFPNFTLQENRGKEIFMSPEGGCRACHGSEAFTLTGLSRNNGLDLVTTDIGFFIVNSNPAFESTFKVTSLRNVELTAPYMHDGRFNTLEQVVEHYSTGVKNHPTLSAPLRLPNGNPRLLNLTPQDKAALVAFLKTLTDPTVATEPKYSNPFRNP